MPGTVEHSDAGETKPLRVLITGASGFVGSAVVEKCLSAGMSVVPTGRSAAAVPIEGYFTADITAPDSLSEAMRNVDSVVHIAGLAHQFHKSQDPLPFFEINLKGTNNVARSAAAAGVRHFVFISTVVVYGTKESGPRDESTPCNPEGPYAESKYQAEQRAAEIIGQTGACLTILRPAAVYGAGDRGNIARLMRAIDRRRFVWLGRGSNRKSLIHREDLARVCVEVLRAGCEGKEVYNVADAAYTMREIVETIAGGLRRSIPPFHIPSSLALSTAKVAAGLTGGMTRLSDIHGLMTKWLADDVYDGGKFQRRFNFKPAMKLSDGLREEVEWYLSRVR